MNQPSDERPCSIALDPDEELLEAARNAREGDLRSFEQLVLRYQTRVVANCRYITGDRNNAEDLAQEVLVKAFFGLPRFEGRSSFAGWLRRIKVNHCLNHLKKQAGWSLVGIEEQHVREFDQLKDLGTADSLAGAISNHRLIGEVLDSMPSALRIPLLLCDMDELTYEEVAQSLGISLSAAKMRIKRGRDLFRERYGRRQLTRMPLRENER